jgi:hypothetical protein
MPGCGWSLPVKVWPSGADWIILSFAKRSAAGGTMDKPAGGGLFLEIEGARAKGFGFSIPLADSGGPSPLADLSSLDSMIDRCWSLTEILLCNCSLMVGSCVWKPGDRQASPTSCIEAPADGLELSGAGMAVVVFKSSFLGLWRAFGAREGDEGGSFFTIILGFVLVRDLVMSAWYSPMRTWLESLR